MTDASQSTLNTTITISVTTIITHYNVWLINVSSILLDEHNYKLMIYYPFTEFPARKEWHYSIELYTKHWTCSSPAWLMFYSVVDMLMHYWVFLADSKNLHWFRILKWISMPTDAVWINWQKHQNKLNYSRLYICWCNNSFLSKHRTLLHRLTIH